MPFDSKVFLLFCVVVLLVHHNRAIPWWARRVALLAFSYGFYASWSPAYLPFLVFSTVIDWEISRRLERARTGRKLLLAASIGLNLGLLAYFKYAGFLAGLWSSTEGSSEPSFVPLGISFFTFQTMSYTIDVYRRRTRACRRITDFAIFVSFFPQLVSGPVVRADELLPQLEQPPEARAIAWGPAGALVLLGLFQKTVLADGLLAPMVARLYETTAVAAPTRLDHLVGIYAFWGQLYADFAGYSNLAIGLALALGVRLPENFRCPHAATAIADFWRRWHMTLTRWFGDYVYKPLGGSRVGPWRAAANVMIVMFLVGLWHGAAWTFVLWGVANAALLLGERVLARLGLGRRVPALLKAIVVFALVGQTCALFRAHDLPHAVSLYGGLLWETAGSQALFGTADLVIWGATLGGMFVAQWLMRHRETLEALERTPWIIRAAVLTLMLSALWMFGGDRNVYIYFDF